MDKTEYTYEDMMATEAGRLKTLRFLQKAFPGIELAKKIGTFSYKGREYLPSVLYAFPIKDEDGRCGSTNLILPILKDVENGKSLYPESRFTDLGKEIRYHDQALEVKLYENEEIKWPKIPK